MNFPQHALSQPSAAGAVGQADVILGLELADYWDMVNSWIDNGEHGIGSKASRIKQGTKLISISSADLIHQVELPGLPALPGGRRADGGRRRSHAAGADRGGEGGDPGERKAAIEKRGEALAQGQRGRPRAHARQRRASAGTRARSAPRGCRMELWTQIKDLDWSLVVADRHVSSWPHAAVADGEALSLARRLGRLRRRL